MDKPTISPVIPRISQQIRLSLILAKSSADLRVLIPLSRSASQAALIDNETGSEIKSFEASSAGRPPKLLDQLRGAIRTKHYSGRTEQAYVHWTRHFILFHKKRHPIEIGEEEVGRFLQHLALNKGVAASTQNQALNALVFLYGSVLRRPLGKLPNVLRAKRPKRLPSVLAQEEVGRLLTAMKGCCGLMARLLYGAGLRLTECTNLRVKDVDFSTNQILIRDGKGFKDRITMLPETPSGGNF